MRQIEAQLSKNAIKVESGKGKMLAQWQKTGGFDGAIEDFNSLYLNDVRVAENGTKIGKYGDNITINVRPFSSQGSATLEIINDTTKRRIKYRYIE